MHQTHTQTLLITEEESLQGHISYLLSHFSYHLGFVNSHWGGNAISGATSSSLRSLRGRKKKQKTDTLFTQAIIHEEMVTLQGGDGRKAHTSHPLLVIYIYDSF